MELKFDDYRLALAQAGAANRTIMELKQNKVVPIYDRIPAANRTIMELKYQRTGEIKEERGTANRTIMELKYSSALV